MKSPQTKNSRFNRKKIQYVNVEEMQDILRYARENYYVIYGETQIPLQWYCYVQDKTSYVEVTLKYKGQPSTYIFRKDLQEQDEIISGMDAYVELAKSYKRVTGNSIPIMSGDYGSASALLMYRNDYDGKRVKAWSYDQNSSYAYAMEQKMPHKLIGRDREVKEGEIGFTECSPKEIEGWTYGHGTKLQMVLNGEGIADYVFDSIDSPFIPFAERWFKRKREAITKAEKNKAKQMLVYSVGYLQRKNPFLRCAIVEYANRYMLKLIDENTIYCNTDSIVSLKPRNDLTIGTGLGEFKLEHEGMFAHTGFNYQWDLDVPSYRRIPKSWFPPNWDILKDEVPQNGNVYELNQLTFELERRENDENFKSV